VRKYLNIPTFFIFSILASFLNYLTYPLLARILGREDFTDTNVALALVSQITSMMSAIVALAISETLYSPKKKGEVVSALQSQVTRLYGVVMLIFIVTSPLIFNLVKLPLKFIIPLSAVLFFTVPIAIISGYFNGKSLLTKLGAVGLIVASSQFTVAIIFAILSKSGSVSILGMALGQAAAIIICYRIFKSERLPTIRESVSKKPQTTSTGMAHRTIVIASLCILALNILQIADLLLINAKGVDQQMYSDISIVSRVVFFGASMFIWVFLAKIRINDSRSNAKSFVSLTAISLGIFAIGSILFCFLGDFILKAITGTTYYLPDIRFIGLASILYRILYVPNISVVLYLIVTRNRHVALVPIWLTIVSVATSIAIVMLDLDTLHSITLFNLAGLSGLIFTGAFFRKSFSRDANLGRSDIIQ